jgi:hypothetical protein
MTLATKKRKENDKNDKILRKRIGSRMGTFVYLTENQMPVLKDGGRCVASRQVGRAPAGQQGSG